MYSKICPAAKFVTKRITRIRGRSMIEINSTRGSKTLKLKGDPLGNMCEKNPLKSEIVAHIIIGAVTPILTSITTL